MQEFGVNMLECSTANSTNASSWHISTSYSLKSEHQQTYYIVAYKNVLIVLFLMCTKVKLQIANVLPV